MNEIEEENEIAHRSRGIGGLPAERRSDVRLPPLLQQAAHTPPSPDAAHESTVEDGHGFPAVDWDYWQDINPDVIGWVTIPAPPWTPPSFKLMETPPGYYLKHDVYGNYNPAGAIYLDADCEELGLSSRNAVILGHHFWNDKKVAPMGTVADYKDVDFAREHARVLIQTPNTKMTYEARFAQIVNGRERNKRIDFEGESDFRAWYGESRANAAMVLDAETEPEQVISLVTCSYNIWSITSAPSSSRVCGKRPRIKPKVRKSHQTHPEPSGGNPTYGWHQHRPDPLNAPQTRFCGVVFLATF